jgi:hypothetical protein
MSGSARQRRVLAPGEVIQFRAKRRFLTTASMAFGPLLVGGTAGALAPLVSPWAAAAFVVTAVLARIVYVFTVPPKGGRRSYDVTATGLVVHTLEEHVVIPWHDVEDLFHRPPASTHRFRMITIHHEFLELFVRGREKPILVQGVYRQHVLSRLIIDQCREHLVRALWAEVDYYGEVHYGDFRVDRDGVHAFGELLRWRTDWRVRRYRREEGVVLTITAPDRQRITGQAPVEMIMRDLLAGQRVAVSRPPPSR